MVAHAHCQPEAWSAVDVNDFWDGFSARPIGTSTLHVAFWAIRFAAVQLGRPEITVGIKPPVKPYRMPQVLSTHEVARLLRHCPNLKDRALFHLIYASGLRLSEATALRREDLDFERGQVFVRQGKNRRDRYTVLGESTIPVLKAYMTRHRPSGHRLFPGATGWDMPMNPRTVQDSFSRALRRAGITRRTSIHGLRHAFAVHLAETNVSPYIIMRLLGHSEIKTTMVYLRTSRVERMTLVSPADQLGLENDFSPDPHQEYFPWVPR